MTCSAEQQGVQLTRPENGRLTAGVLLCMDRSLSEKGDKLILHSPVT